MRGRMQRKEIDIHERIHRHNVLKICQGVLYILFSLLLWVVSYWAFYVLCAFPLFLWGVDSVGEIAEAAAWIGIVLLVVEGIRYTKPVFDMISYSASSRAGGWTGTEQEGTLRSYMGRPFSTAYLLSQILFSAPRLCVLSVQAFRSVISADRETVQAASELFAFLQPRKEWTPVREFCDRGPALMVLQGLHLLRTRMEGEELQVKVSAAERTPGDE